MGTETPGHGVMADSPGGAAAGRADRHALFLAALTLAGLGSAVLLWSALCTVPSIHWNSARLAPSFALAYGQSIYALRDSAAQLGWIYGPVFPLWNLPATLTENPTWALVIGGIQNVVTVVAPLVWLVAASGAGRRAALSAGVFGTALMLGSPVLRLTFLYLHVDAVCVAAGLVGCGALWRATQGRRGALHVAAIAVVLAVWTKQLAIMLVPGMLIWLWRERQRQLMWPLLFRGGCYGASATVAIFTWFGADKVLFNVVFFHTRHPSRGGLELIGNALASLGGSLWAWLPAVAWIAWLAVRRRPARVLPTAAGSLVRLLLWVALTQLPLGLAALLQQGGGLNSLHAFHYVMAAGLVVLAHAFAPAAGAGARHRHAAAWSVALLLPVAAGFSTAWRTHAAWRVGHELEGMVAMVREKPRTYYFPWNPLVTLIGERRIYPFDDALYCLWLRKLDVPVEIVRAALPPRPIIVYEEPVQSKFALNYFPELNKRQ